MPETMQDITPDAFLAPEHIIRSFDLKPGDHVADFGVGHGHFVIALSRAVGGDGKVYAIDIQKSALDIVENRAKLEHLWNIETIRGDVEMPRGSKLKDRFVDFVLAANILFQIEERAALFAEARRILVQNGRFAVIEWDETPSSLGPPIASRIKKEAIKQLAASAGFAFDRECSAGSHHYGLLFVNRYTT